MPGYLAARFTGAGAPGEALQQFELIAEQCRRAKSNKLLIDITGYAVKASLADRFYAGERFRIFARYGIQVAFVCTLDQVDPQNIADPKRARSRPEERAMGFRRRPSAFG
jgi:hypothetical protein